MSRTPIDVHHLRRLRHRPVRRAVRPGPQWLEQRLAPANVPVLSAHYDGFLSGANTQETTLTPANVNPAGFGRLFNYAVDGYVYAQPLYVPNMAIAGGTHNVVLAATEHDSVYAFDADGGGLLWKRSFIDPANGVTTVPQPDVISGDIVPEIGITGTPVIDAANTMYVVVKTKEVVGGTAHYVQRLHALDLTTGLDRPNGVVTIGDTTIGGPDGGYTDTTNVSMPGTGAGSDGTTLRFNALRESPRSALALVNGVVYIAWASHGDNGPYHGWVVGYGAGNIAGGPVKVFNTSPNGNASGIWESGGGLGVDAQNNIYFATGNGFGTGFDPSVGSYSESVLKLSTTGQLTVADYFTPTDWQTLDQNDADLGSGGTMLLPDAVGSSTHPHLMIETGKTGRLYLIDRDNMGRNNTPNADRNVQTVTLGGPGVWGNPAFFQDGPNTGLIYYWGTSAPATAFRITSGVVDPTPVTMTNFDIGFPGAQPSISSNGADPNSAIMWALRVDNFGQNGPAELMAFKAEDFSQELYSSNGTGQRDQFGSSVKFIDPIVSNGHVYAGSNGFLSVFGLFPAATAAPNARSNLSGAGVQGGTQVHLTWTNPTGGQPATGIKIFRSTDGTNYTLVNTVARDVNAYTDTGLAPATLYHYRVVATNQVGDSPASNTLDIRTRVAAPVLQITDLCVGEIDLRWTATANDHYQVERGDANGANFVVVAANIPASQTTFSDTGLANGTYTYRVTGFSTFTGGGQSNDSAVSNVAKATIGPVNIAHVDPSATDPNAPGFLDHSDMQANGSAFFSTDEHLLRLNNNFGQAGSAFTVQQVGIRGFTTRFHLRLHEGTQPDPADGLTFTIQANSPTALGGGGGALGYQGIGRSLAIKLDVFDNEGETFNSTGLFSNGDFPGLPHAAGEVSIALDPNNVNLRSQSVKTITLTYDGVAHTLTETIHDPAPGQLNHGDFTTTYNVDLAAKLGVDTAYVGFTGGTGGLFSVQDVLNWTYNEQETNLPPRAPTGVRVVQVDRHDHNRSDITLDWNCNNAYTAQGFIVEQSSDGVNWTQISQVSAGTTSITFSKLGTGVYYYRVRSFNAIGTSQASNVTSVDIAGGDNPFDLSFTSFNDHSVLTQNGAAHFTPDPIAVGTFSGHQDIGSVAAAGGASFTGGSYTLQASGGDIWDVHDQFQYVYKSLTGNGEIIARAVNIQNTDFWAKGGLMIREGLDSNSKNAFMFETPSPDHEEPVFQWRADTTGQSADSGNHVNHLQAAPVWLRLVRNGNKFSGYWAEDNGDGTHGHWNRLGNQVSISMNQTVFIGLALTAHNNDGRINTSTFDNVTITGNTSAPLPATKARLTDGDLGEASTVFTRNAVSFNDFTTSFTYQENPRIGGADGITFVMQSDPRGANAVGGGGGGLGYTGIANSIAVKLDIYNAAAHTSSTGLYQNGEPPDSAAGRARSVFMNGAGIDLNSGHVFRIDLAHNSSSHVLSETVIDTATNAVFRTSYTVDIEANLGSSVGYVGFSGGTGGETSVQDVLTWTYHSGRAISGTSAIVIQPPASQPGTSTTLTADPVSDAGRTASPDLIPATVPGGPAPILGPTATDSSTNADPVAADESPSSGPAEPVLAGGWDTRRLGVRQKVKRIDGYLDDLAAALN